MFEKVNPSHPDKIADRIAGAIVDMAYKNTSDPKIAVEVLIGHGDCYIISETSVHFEKDDVEKIVERICGKKIFVKYNEVPQDFHLAENQKNAIRCGDNGIFKGVPVTDEQQRLSKIAHEIYKEFLSDGKYILNGHELIICQSNANDDDFQRYFDKYNMKINPLGYWTGGTDVDSGATNRKLGSDMGDAVTGGGLHGKDLSKADVSVNIYAHLMAQQTGHPVQMYCAIGDEYVDGHPYFEIVDIARNYIRNVGGFEKFAEWGLI